MDMVKYYLSLRSLDNFFLMEFECGESGRPKVDDSTAAFMTFLRNGQADQARKGWTFTPF